MLQRSFLCPVPWGNVFDPGPEQVRRHSRLVPSRLPAFFTPRLASLRLMYP